MNPHISKKWTELSFGKEEPPKVPGRAYNILPRFIIIFGHLDGKRMEKILLGTATTFLEKVNDAVEQCRVLPDIQLIRRWLNKHKNIGPCIQPKT